MKKSFILCICILMMLGLVGCKSQSSTPVPASGQNSAATGAKDAEDSGDSQEPEDQEENEEEAWEGSDEIVLVRMVREWQDEITAMDKNVSVFEVYEYDENGICIHKEDNKKSYDYIYDDSGRLTEMHIGAETYIYTYDDDGTLRNIKRYRSGDVYEEYRYDADGHEVYHDATRLSDGTLTESQYDENGNCVFRSIYYKTYPGYTIPETEEYTYTYDDQNQLIKEIMKLKGRTGGDVTVYTYNDSGYSYHKSYYNNPEDPSTEQRNYTDGVVSFDEHGNKTVTGEKFTANVILGGGETTNFYYYHVYDYQGDEIIYYGSITGMPPETVNLEYNEQGQILSLEYSSREGNLPIRYNYEYLDDGRILSVTYISEEDGTLDYVDRYTYMSLADFFKLKEEAWKVDKSLAEYFKIMDKAEAAGMTVEEYLKTLEETDTEANS